MGITTEHWFENDETSNSFSLDSYIQQSKEDEKKIYKLLKLCYIFSEAIYNYISKFNYDSAIEYQLENLKELKNTVDINIADENYKSYLKHRYIDKDYFLDENSIDEAVKAANSDAMKEITKGRILKRELPTSEDIDDNSFSNIRTE